MTDLNKITTDVVTQFSTNEQVCLALIGKYGKLYTREYKMTLVKNLCFVNTLSDCEMQLPDHYAFSYTDDTGRHVVDETVNTISVKGICSFFFTIKNS